MKKLRYAFRDQIEMQIMSLDQMLPTDHLAREIWAYVEKMDLTKLLEEVDSIQGEPGAPAFDPRTLMCLWLDATASHAGEGPGGGQGARRKSEETAGAGIGENWKSSPTGRPRARSPRESPATESCPGGDEEAGGKQARTQRSQAARASRLVD